MGKSMTFGEQVEIENIVKELDMDGDNKISYQEFIQLMTSK